MNIDHAGTALSGTRGGGPAVTAADVIGFIEHLAQAVPERASGIPKLRVGTPEAPVHAIVIAHCATLKAVAAARSLQSALLVTAAPLAGDRGFLDWDDPVASRLIDLAARKVCLYSLPDSYAGARGGHDDSLAERLGISSTSILASSTGERRFKLVVFVPQSACVAVREAAASAGAGVIGRYTHCSFETPGHGTFVPQEGSVPFIGTPGRMERVEEVRLEMVVSEPDVERALRAVAEAHPYEEPACDIYPLVSVGSGAGRGRGGELLSEVDVDALLSHVSAALGLTRDYPARCLHRGEAPIRSLAAWSGAEGTVQAVRAAHRGGVGAVVVGGASVEAQLAAEGADITLIDVGCTASVAPGLERLCAQLHREFDRHITDIVCAT